MNEPSFQTLSNGQSVRKLLVDARVLALLAKASTRLMTHGSAEIDLRQVTYSAAKLLRAVHSACPFGEIMAVSEEDEEATDPLNEPQSSHGTDDTRCEEDARRALSTLSSPRVEKSIIRVTIEDLPRMTTAIELMGDGSQAKKINKQLLDSKVLAVLSKACTNVMDTGEDLIDLGKLPYLVGWEIRRIYNLCPFGQITQFVEET